jgi:ribonuclease Y
LLSQQAKAEITMGIIYEALALVVGVVAGYYLRENKARSGTGDAEREAKRILTEAETSAKNTLAEAKEKAAEALLEAEKEERARKEKLSSLEDRLLKREEAMDNKLNELSAKEKELSVKLDSVREQENKATEFLQAAETKLQAVSGLSREEAKTQLMQQVEESIREEMSSAIQKFQKERRDEVEKQALDVITTALQRYARAHVSELTTSVFPLKDEDLKGKIIGREGRNIRSIERETGCELIVDEVPDGIVVSSFDPLRREIAKLALEKLVKDGRIQPAKIEEKVEEARTEINKKILEVGEEACADAGVYDLPKEIVQLLGRLNYRTSFGQNVLWHSVEMSHLAGMIAGELGLNVAVAKKAALVHDIGKAIDHEVEGTHIELGRKILKKCGIDERVIHAMESHHEDYPYTVPEAFVVTTADILSSARPGSRRGTMENYIKRLADLEKIALDFQGVKTAYAISAGRELRVFVTPEKVDDFSALDLARRIANRIQSELRYPGEIKVNVIRESRAVEYAR